MIRAFIDGWNYRKHPFAWTKTADEILRTANRQSTLNGPLGGPYRGSRELLAAFLS